MSEIKESTLIAGVKFVYPKIFTDERGRFTESFRKEWFPEREWDRIQTNCSENKAGALRGLHYHFHQIDYWYITRGTIRVVLVDLRQSSSTKGAQEILEISAKDPVGVFIPIGVGHGFSALTDVTLTYLVDNYYDGSDEFGVIWNDPTLNIDWGIENPHISPRDLKNPTLDSINPSKLPQ